MAGLFGIASKSENCVKDLFYGTDYHSHLAANWAGVAILTPEGPIFRKSSQTTNFKAEFSVIRDILGKYAIGVMSNERQPICKRSQLGNFALATDAAILNLKEILEELYKKGDSLSESSFEEINHTEVIAQLICQEDSIEKGIARMFKKLNGSCSLIILTDGGLYAARDTNGANSLVLGKRDDTYAIASETSAFQNLGFEIVRSIEPGEILFINENGCQQKGTLGCSKRRHCTFNWIYFSDPAAVHEGMGVEEARYACGAALAKKDSIKADLVCGVPDSGTAHAVGYANASGIPYKRALIKYTAGWSRSYMPPKQERRDEIAHFKLIPIASLIKDKEIILVDDSIRRGTQLRRLLEKKIWPLGPKKVHIRVASPPQLYPCIKDKADASRLAARRAIFEIEGKEIEDYSEYMDETSEKYKQMVEGIRKEIGATTLAFISLSDMAAATKVPKENLCLHCWTGKF